MGALVYSRMTERNCGSTVHSRSTAPALSSRPPGCAARLRICRSPCSSPVIVQAGRWAQSGSAKALQSPTPSRPATRIRSAAGWLATAWRPSAVFVLMTATSRREAASATSRKSSALSTVGVLGRGSRSGQARPKNPHPPTIMSHRPSSLRTAPATPRIACGAPSADERPVAPAATAKTAGTGQAFGCPKKPGARPSGGCQLNGCGLSSVSTLWSASRRITPRTLGGGGWRDADGSGSGVTTACLRSPARTRLSVAGPVRDLPSSSVMPASIGESRCDRVAFDELPSDDVALDLVGAFTDDHQRRIAEVALHVELCRVPVAPVDPHRVQGDLHGGLGCEQLGHARFHVGTL